MTTAELSEIGQRARLRVAHRLLPFVFLIYIVNYIDRVNVSFANLRMSADLGFSVLHNLRLVRDTWGYHRRALERKEMDCTNHDLVGIHHDSYRICAQRR